MKSIKILLIILSVLIVACVYLGLSIIGDSNRAKEYKAAVIEGDKVLGPFIKSISFTSYDSVKMVNGVNKKASMNFVRDHPDERYLRKAEIINDVAEALRECSCALSFDIYDIKDRLLLRTYLDKDGNVYSEETKESGAVRDMFISGSLINEGEIYMSKFYETVNPLTKEKIDVISYVSPIRSREGQIIGLGALTVPLSQFFSDFDKQSIPKGLFVVDNEGNYLWHSDKNRVLESLKQKDSSFFADFSKSYPDILADRGELRVWDENTKDYIEVRSIYPAFEVVVDGAVKKINAQETPNANRVWFIGYEE